MNSLGFAFLRDRRGNIAMLTALMIFGFGGIVGAAIDYSRAVYVRTELQARLDAATFSIAREAARDNDKLTQMLVAQMATDPVESHGFARDELAASITDDGLVRTNASGKIQTTFFKSDRHQ